MRIGLNLNHIKEFLLNGYINPLVIDCYAMEVYRYSEQSYFQYEDEDEDTNLPLDKKNITEKDKRVKLIGKSYNIISFGDSHGVIFSNLDYIKHYPLKAGTAYNINNPNSTSGSNKEILNKLKDYEPSQTSLIITLGEVDLRRHIHKQARVQNKLPEIVTIDAINNYMDFIDSISSLGYSILVNTPHTGGGDKVSSIPEIERNDTCEYMNIILKQKCNKRRLRCDGLFDVVVNRLTRKNILKYYRDPSHLHLPNTSIGEYLQSNLLGRLFRSNYSYDQSSENNANLDSICRVLVSDIPGWNSFNLFQTNVIYKNAMLISDNRMKIALIELPFPILIQKLITEIEVSLGLPIVNAHAIYQSCDPSVKINQENVLKGIAHMTRIKNSQKVKIEHDFSQYKFSNMHCRYILITVSKGLNSKLTKFDITRMRYMNL